MGLGVVLRISGNLAIGLTGTGPASPGTPTASVVGSSVSLTWTPSVTVGATHRVERSSDSGGSFSTVTTNAAGGAYTDSTTAAGTPYLYRIIAVGFWGEAASGNSNEVTPVAGVPPSAPFNPVGVTITSSSFQLSFGDTSTNETSFEAQRAADVDFTTSVVQVNVSANVTSATFSGLTASTTYFARVRAVNSYGNSDWSAAASSVTTLAPSSLPTPSALAATAQRDNLISLTWTNPSTSAIYVRVRASTDGGSNWSLEWQRQVRAAKFLAAGLTPNTTYTFDCTLYDGTNYGTPSGIASATTPSAVPAPSVISGLSLAATNAKQVEGSFTLTANYREDGCHVERSEDGGSVWKRVANLYRGVAGFTDRNAPANITGLQYRVRTTNTTADSAWVSGSVNTPAVSGSAPAAPTWPTYAGVTGYDAVLPASDTIIHCEVTLSDDVHDGVSWELSSDGGSNYTEVSVTGRYCWTTYITGLTASTAYKVRARTFNAGGFSSYTSAKDVTTLGSGQVYSPTGRLPKILMTPQRLKIYYQMYTDWLANPTSPATLGGKIWKLITEKADSSNTSSAAYRDYGNWAACRYQILGNAADANNAYQQATKQSAVEGTAGWATINFLTQNVPGNNLNHVREYFPDLVTIYDWCYSGWTAGQRTIYTAGMNNYADFCNGTNARNYQGGFRAGVDQVNDSDQNTGQFWGTILWDVASYPENGKAGTYNLQNVYSQSSVNGSTGLPFGGIRPTASNRVSVVNTCSWEHATQTAGGEWCESSEYNQQTANLARHGCEGFRYARSLAGDNQDYHPTMRAVVVKNGLVDVGRITPDRTALAQYGDEQSQRLVGGNDLFTNRQTCLVFHAGAHAGLSSYSPYTHYFFNAIWTAALKSGNSIWGHAAWMLNPYLTGAAPTGLPSQTTYSSGQGTLYHHDGWATTDSLAFLHMPTRCRVDHEINNFRDFQLWRKNEWAQTKPIGYAGVCPEGECSNTMLFSGLSSMGGLLIQDAQVDANAFRGPIAQESGEGIASEYVYLAGATYGNYFRTGFFARPPTFLYEWTSSLVYLPSSDKASDTIIVFDRTLNSDPLYLPAQEGVATPTGLSKFASTSNGISNLNRLTVLPNTGTPFLQWVIHSPVSPTDAGGVLSWTTAGGTLARIRTLLPASGTTRTIYAESTLFSTPSYPATQTWPGSSERKYQTKITLPSPGNATPQWNTWLHVCQYHNSGATIGATLVQSSAGNAADGCVVTRGGLNDVVAMFSAKPSTRVNNANGTGTTTFNRVLSTGYTFTWTAGTATTNVRLFDLSPAASWSYTLDGGSPTSLSVSANGVGKFDVSGSGSHTVVLTGA